MTDLKYFKDGIAKHFMRHKIYCSYCSHYETEVEHWDGTSFTISIVCSKCGETTDYAYDNPYDVNGWKKK